MDAFFTRMIIQRRSTANRPQDNRRYLKASPLLVDVQTIVQVSGSALRFLIQDVPAFGGNRGSLFPPATDQPQPVQAELEVLAEVAEKR